MAKMVSEDIADDLMNEKVKITISDTAADEYVQEVLSANNWAVQSNAYQERKAYTGTVAYVPYLDDVEVDGEGAVIAGTGRIRLNYFEAGNIYPLSWLNGIVEECAFVSVHTVHGKKYAHIQVHVREREEREYIIYNHVVECTNGAGRELEPAEWKQLRPFRGMSEKAYTGSDKRQFVIDRLNIVNNVDPDNPMGVSVFANGIDQLRGIDIAYDSYVNEFILGKKRIFVAPEMLNRGMDGSPVFDPNDVTFYQLPEDSLKEGEALKEVNMEIRAEAHSRAIDDFLNILSVKCGFGTEHYRFEKGSIQTATQVISENSDLYKTIVKHEIILEAVLKELVAIILRLGNILGASFNEDAEVVIDFDDSIIEDKATERKEDRNDVAMGAMRLDEYRAKWYGETLEEAAKNLPEVPEVEE
ncbi:phage portal protein [Lacrimispora sp. 210928-DFI.3.58]|uniref:phage portal protein n=1 Tax=Lacrimispora sp. 210928-DFI.3.58 TaxID=2883214 RepID=UPI001D0706B3|nr:phage portal protein [Lacrimispora sp. 210928-DFI.3.58]MCB7321094.1 phage portal protein [Lacrimispora sp. 210928-DFI.3.58]